jgi:methionyl-tRNA synthetase
LACLRAIGHLFQIFKIARKRRLFVCGSDEHGVAISMKAKRRHYATEVIDKYDGIIRKSFSDFGISFDN